MISWKKRSWKDRGLLVFKGTLLVLLLAVVLVFCPRFRWYVNPINYGVGFAEICILVHWTWGLDTILNLSPSLAHARTYHNRPLLYNAVSLYNADAARVLIAASADINYKDFQGSLIHEAVRRNNLAAVKLLAEAGADLEERGLPLQNTPLLTAVLKNRPEIVEYLIAAGADLDARESTTMSALHRAAWANNYTLVKMLVTAGADVNSRDSLDRTPLEYATEERIWDHLYTHPTYQKDEQLLHRVVRRDSTALVRYLLQHKYPVNNRNEHGMTPLFYAWEEEIFLLLVQHGADLTIRDDDGCSAEESFPDHLKHFFTLVETPQ